MADVVYGLPGRRANLARLSGLLRPTLEGPRVEDVVRLIAGLRDERFDVAEHLFGQERVRLGKVREAYFGEFGACCFYCETGLGAANPIDHPGLPAASTCRRRRAARCGSRTAYAVVDSTWLDARWLRVDAWRHGAPAPPDEAGAALQTRLAPPCPEEAAFT